MHEQMRHQWLAAWAQLVSRWPRVILLLAVALAAAAVWVTLDRLRFEPNRNALIADTLEFNRRYLDWIATFPGTDDMYIVVDTHDAEGRPDPATAQLARRLVDALAAKLQAEPTVEAVAWGFAPDQAHPKTLRIAPPEEFDAQMDQLEQARLILESPSMDAFFEKLVQRVNSDMNVQTVGAEGIPREQFAFFLGLLDAVRTRLTTDAAQPVGVLARAQANLVEPWQYLATRNERLLMIRITPKPEADALDPFDLSIRQIRRIMDEVRPDFPGIDFGLTGINVIESDETVAVQRDMTIVSSGGTVLIAILLVLAFHSFRLPIIMTASLGVAIIWTFGFATLAVGHLQVISITFISMLLGDGIAYAFYLASRFEHVRHHHGDDAEGMRSSLRDMFTQMAPGVAIGAFTTSAAFATTIFTDFRGVAEMGLISAVGFLLCLAAMFSVFPALLMLFKSRHKHLVRLEDRYIHFYEDRWVSPFWRHPWLTLTGTALLFVASLSAIHHARFDYNLLQLLPRGMDSVAWQERIIHDGEQSIYTGVSIADSLEEAARRAQQFRALDTVASVDGIGAILPPDADDRARRVRKLREFVDRTRPVPSPRPPTPMLSQLAGMQFGLAGTMGNTPEPLRSQLAAISAGIDAVLNAGRALPPEQLEARLAALQPDFERMQQDLRAQLERVLDDSPITVEDLSPAAIGSYYADTPTGRKYALEINPKLPEGVNDPLDPAFLGRFVEDLERVDPAATGVIVQVYHSGTLILHAYIKAGIIALVVVTLLVWIEFRSIVDAVATLVPVAVGFAVTFGILYLLGLSINPANIIVLPLMFGLGVDFGVHIIHRYRLAPDTRPLGLSGGTGKGITLAACTSIFGFGSMAFASHRGIADIGLVLAIGIGLTLLACLIVMPAWLELRRRRRPRPPVPADEGAAW